MLYYLCSVLFFSWVMTGAVRQYALLRKLFDTPNARSAHQKPTPRGGGLGIVISLVFALYFATYVCGVCIAPQSFLLLSASLLVAGVGFLDDHGFLNVAWRLFFHSLAALGVLLAIKGCPPILLFGGQLSPSLFADVLAFFYVVWLINLYNFMDGLDGLAALEALCACGGMVFIYWASNHSGLLGMPLLLLVCVLGFLCWNWPPARIFMGDEFKRVL